MRSHHEEIRRRGAEIVAIGTGNPMYAKDFIQQFDIDFLVLIDADAEAANAANVRKGSRAQVMGPAAIMRGVKTFLGGGKQGRPGARILQLGATFVIEPGGRIRYEHYAQASSDNAPMGEVLAALPPA